MEHLLKESPKQEGWGCPWLIARVAGAALLIWLVIS